jgi:flagellar hook protein FlgE
LTSDGYGIGSLEGLEVGADGIIIARYSNGQALQDFRLGMVDFPNEDGLEDMGNSLFTPSAGAGSRLLSFAGVNGLGGVVANSLESSNVDLTTELVDLIQFQKAYRGNAKVISTANKLDETTLNLDR